MVNIIPKPMKTAETVAIVMSFDKVRLLRLKNIKFKDFRAQKKNFQSFPEIC